MSKETTFGPGTRISEVWVCAVPETVRGHQHYALMVQWRKSDEYVVSNSFGVLNAEGEWEYEPSNSERTPEFIARTRFSFTDALALAQRMAPEVEVNGRRAKEWATSRSADE